jgi:hypothetical protein
VADGGERCGSGAHDGAFLGVGDARESGAGDGEPDDARGAFANQYMPVCAI